MKLKVSLHTSDLSVREQLEAIKLVSASAFVAEWQVLELVVDEDIVLPGQFARVDAMLAEIASGVSATDEPELANYARRLLRVAASGGTI